MTEFISDQGGCRTAPATPGLLKTTPGFKDMGQKIQVSNMYRPGSIICMVRFGLVCTVVLDKLNVGSGA